jgi:hypothetical protein
VECAGGLGVVGGQEASQIGVGEGESAGVSTKLACIMSKRTAFTFRPSDE